MIPPEVLKKIELARQQNARTLDLSRNHLTEIPKEISQLQNLQSLDLSSNQITKIPKEIAQLKALQSLYLYSNQVTEIPKEISQLQNLRSLDLSSNQITKIPKEVAQLQNLQSFYLQKNKLPIPPEILEKVHRPKVIFEHYFSSDQKKPLHEAKMLLVGQGSVGKTSLAKRLLENDFNEEEEKTDGINIRDWAITVEGNAVRMNVWDFGGQEIMHSTHQFFLTRRSLYLLVLDNRQDEKDNRLEYWLRIIKSFGENSPVIIVGNKSDQHPLHLDKTGLQRKYPQIHAFVAISCRENKGFENLKAKIVEEIGQLPHVNDELPLSWFNVKQTLEEMDEDYLTFEKYQEICVQFGIEKENHQETLIGFLHDLGILLNFRDDPRLSITNILNPEWVTEAVYKILNNYAVFQQKGELHIKMLADILNPEHYPRSRHMLIMDMMGKFELCFDFDNAKGKRFLVPDLLPKEEVFTGDWENALAFQLHYGLLPSSIISRFIVRMHESIHQNTYWRTGVLLSNGRNEALVRADLEDQIIFIFVRGNTATRRDFLAEIRSQLDSIHKTIPRLTMNAKVPIPDYPEVIVDYNHLINLESLGENEFVPDGLMKRISVRELLNGIDTPDMVDRRISKKLLERILNRHSETTENSLSSNKTKISPENVSDDLLTISLGDGKPKSGSNAPWQQAVIGGLSVAAFVFIWLILPADWIALRIALFAGAIVTAGIFWWTLKSIYIRIFTTIFPTWVGLNILPGINLFYHSDKQEASFSIQDPSVFVNLGLMLIMVVLLILSFKDKQK